VLHRADQVRKLAEKLAARGERLHFCYEAGPCGYGLYRQLVELGHDCIVVAPSLISMKAGERVKTDRRDAVMLAKLHRADELAAVWVPDAAHEAMRDLVRARSTAMQVAGKARQHLQGFLLRHGRIYPGKKGWTGAYRRWLAMVRFSAPPDPFVGSVSRLGPSRAVEDQRHQTVLGQRLDLNAGLDGGGGVEFLDRARGTMDRHRDRRARLQPRRIERDPDPVRDRQRQGLRRYSRG
jgi:transposase